MITVTLGGLEISVLAALIGLCLLTGAVNAVLLWTFLKSWRKAFQHSDVL